MTTSKLLRKFRNWYVAARGRYPLPYSDDYSMLKEVDAHLAVIDLGGDEQSQTLLLERLDNAGRQGADLSPGDPLARDAAAEIRRLRDCANCGGSYGPVQARIQDC